MPFVKITLSENYEQAEIDLISDAIHRSLMSAFHIPEGDYFHVISRKQPWELKYPAAFMDIKHDEGILYIQIMAALGRTVEQKRLLYKQIALRIAEKTSVNPENLIIMLQETPKENWSLGNGEMQEFKHI